MRTLQAKTIIQTNNNFNIYRGCTHGCIYCDARSTCYQVGDFDDIAIKNRMLEIIDKQLSRKRKSAILTTGAMSDPYVHSEKDLCLMRNTLELIKKHRFGIAVLTKSSMILRDLELYKAINQNHKAIVQLTVTTTDDQLAKLIEPKVTLPSKRLNTLKIFSESGITTGIWMTPILPFITDTEENIRDIVTQAASAGVTFIVNYGMGTTMREGSREHFYQQLDTLFPGLKERYMKTYGRKYICDSPNAKRLEVVFKETCRRHNIIYDHDQIKGLFKKSEPEQLTLL